MHSKKKLLLLEARGNSAMQLLIILRPNVSTGNTGKCTLLLTVMGTISLCTVVLLYCCTVAVCR